MKTYLDTNKHEFVGAISSKKLTIAANGKAFKELISGIYSDKAYAIARETIANCVDSHTAVGTPDRPFDLHIPTAFEPEYVIRDYGTSMTHDVVENLYSTLFLSTKDDPNSDESNKFVGKFGLGSKSPFAYTDAFQVTAFLDGKVRFYDIAFNGGEPLTTLYAEDDTDEPNGIQVNFPVDPKDCADFERAIIRACEPLNFEPNFVGKKPTLNRRTVIREGKRWKLLDSTATGRAEAKQGTVLYPLNKNAVINCPHELFPLFDLTIHLEFPIGELDVITSREGLSYDGDTSANIIRAFEELRAELRDECVVELKAVKTYHEFNCLHHTLSQKYRGPLWSLLNLDTERWKGKRPITSYTVRIQDKVTHTLQEGVGPNGLSLPPLTTREHRFGDLQWHNATQGLTVGYQGIGRFKNHDRHNRIEISATVDKIVLVCEDETIRPRYTSQRLDILKRDRRWHNQNVQIFWVRHSKNIDYAVKRLSAACGRVPVEVIHLKDITYEPYRYSEGGGVYVPDDFKVIRYNQWDSPETGDLAPEEAYYVCLYKGDIENYGQLGIGSLEAIKTHLVAIGEDDLPIVGIPKTKRSQIRKNPGWKELIPLAQQVLPECIDKDVLTALYVQQRHEVKDIHKKILKLRNLLGEGIFDPLVAGTSFTQLWDDHEVVTAWKNKASTSPKVIIDLLTKLHVTDLDVVSESSKEANDVIAAYDRACEQVDRDFALLKHLSLPPVPEVQTGKIVDLVAARERRLAILPFYVWLKSCRPVVQRTVDSVSLAA